MEAQLLQSLCKQFNALTSKLDVYDGSACVKDFVSDLERYCEHLGKEEDADKLNVLVSHITGEAKDVFRLVKSQTFDRF